MTNSLRRPESVLIDLYGEDLLAAELALEERMVMLGADQIRKQIEEARQGGHESDTRYGQALIARTIDEVSEAIQRFIDKARTGGAGRRHIAVKYLEQLDSDVAAFIALRMVIDSLTGRNQILQTSAIQIGRRIEDEVRFTAFADSDSKMYKRGLEKAKKSAQYHRKKATMAGYDRRSRESEQDAEWESWPEQHCLHIGLALIDMIEAAGLITIGDQINGRKDTLKVIEPTQRIVEWVEQQSSKLAMTFPQSMPMVVKPLDWTTPFDGGYLTHDTQGRMPMVKTSNRNYLNELADDADKMPMIYESINALQSTRWKINRHILEVAEEIQERGLGIADLPDGEDISHCACPKCEQYVPLPKTNTRGSTEHECFEDEEVLKQWKRRAYELHTKNMSTRSKRLSLIKTLRTAKTYLDFDAIYMPYQLDFRGRVYAIPTFCPQGNDVTKGLLHFADAKPIEDGVAAGWLAIQGANVWGFDKASLEDRIQWVEDHEQEIIAAADCPMENRWWCGADKPFQFLAFCFEWAGFLRVGYGYPSRLAIALDGSCSGIQHFSAMLRDPVGGAAVNLIPQDVPADIYQRVCDRVIIKLHSAVSDLSSTIAKAISPELNPSSLPKEGEESLSYKPKATNLSYNPKAIAQQGEDLGWSEGLYAAGWLYLEPSRKTTKRQVMTLPYGSTLFSCREYTDVWYRDRINAIGHSPFNNTMAFKAVTYLSGLIWEAITEEVIGSREAMAWLQQCAKVVAAEQLPVYWTTPVGFRVMQQYNTYKARRVKTKMGDAIVKLTMREEEDTIDQRRMQNAISPNFVHSMDATHLVMSVCYAVDNGIQHFAMIHDSFGCHAADTARLGACLREAFVDLYSDMDVLDDFREQILRQVDEADMKKIPELPSKGSLDLEKVRDSDFFFA
ncbi:DNA-directed RNA polymerase [Pseudovibrio ascidiaceicola]|uniref:DNA-directed RNA polymerase n=1 Tax=Pseudovibrio ascidiaceicola TaxID=285279 RepID=UPI003D36DFDD